MFDDAALSLFHRGCRFRLRVAADSSELTVKIADQDCAHLPPGLVPPREGKCEYDVHVATVTDALSLNHRVGAGTTRDLLAGRLSLADALSEA